MTQIFASHKSRILMT